MGFQIPAFVGEFTAKKSRIRMRTAKRKREGILLAEERQRWRDMVLYVVGADPHICPQTCTQVQRWEHTWERPYRIIAFRADQGICLGDLL
jgi:hypothetical protein